MSESITEMKTEQEFHDTIKTGTVLVDFFATWCPPCRAQLPILTELADKLGTTVKIIKVNTDELSSLAAEYQVSNIPTLVLLKNGQVIDRFVGLQQGATLETALRSA